MSMDSQGAKRRRKIVENFNWLSRVHQRYRQTDDRQTDARAIAYSEREREFTFAKNADRSAQLSPSPCTVLYTYVGGQCDELVTDDRHQFTTLTVTLS